MDGWHKIWRLDFFVHRFDDEKRTYANHGNLEPKKWSSGWLIRIVLAKDGHRDKFKLGPLMSPIPTNKRFTMKSWERTISDWSSSKIPMKFFTVPHFHRGWIFLPQKINPQKTLWESQPNNRFFFFQPIRCKYRFGRMRSLFFPPRRFFFLGISGKPPKNATLQNQKN